MDIIQPTTEKRKKKKVRRKVKIEKAEATNNPEVSLLDIVDDVTQKTPGSSRRGSYLEDIGKIWSDRRRSSAGLSSGGEDKKRRDSKDEVEKNKLRLEKSIALMKRRTSEAKPKFLWDEVLKEKEVEKTETRRKRSDTMSREAAMSVLGLGKTDSKKRPRKISDYTEDDLLQAFRTECSLLESGVKTGKPKTQQDMHEAYQCLLKVVRAKNKFRKNVNLAGERKLAEQMNAPE